MGLLGHGKGNRAVGRAAGALEGITAWDDGTWKFYDRAARTGDAGVLDALFEQ